MKLTVFLIALLAHSVISLSANEGDVAVVAQFSKPGLELTEGVAVDKAGNVYVSVSPLLEVRKADPQTGTAELLGKLDEPINLQTDNGMLGLAVDAPGNVYAAVVSFSNTAAHGVWKFHRKNGEASKLPGTENIVFPNSLAFDKRGNLYVTDSRFGAVWRVPKGGGDTELWIQDDLLEGNGSLGVFIGANGIVYRHGTLYVANTEKGSIVRIPIEKGGGAGAPALEVPEFTLLTADGIAMDVHGNLYVAMVVYPFILPFQANPSAIVRVNLDGSIETIASGSPFDFTTSLAFGKRGCLFAVNASNGDAAGIPPGFGPALVKIDVDTPGLPLP